MLFQLNIISIRTVYCIDGKYIYLHILIYILFYFFPQWLEVMLSTSQIRKTFGIPNIKIRRSILISKIMWVSYLHFSTFFYTLRFHSTTDDPLWFVGHLWFTSQFVKFYRASFIFLCHSICSVAATTLFAELWPHSYQLASTWFMNT